MMRPLIRTRWLAVAGGAIALGTGVTGASAATIATFTPGTGFGGWGASWSGATATADATGSGRMVSTTDGYSVARASVNWGVMRVSLPPGTTSATVDLNLSYRQKLTGAARTYVDIGGATQAGCSFAPPAPVRLNGRAKTITVRMVVSCEGLDTQPLGIVPGVGAATPDPPRGRNATFDVTLQVNSVTVSVP